MNLLEPTGCNCHLSSQMAHKFLHRRNMFLSTQFHGNRQLPALEVPSSSTVQTHAPSKKNYLVSPDTIFNSSSLEKLFSGEKLFFNNGRLRASYDCADEVIRLCSDHPKYGKYSNVESVWLTKENPLAEVKRDILQLLIKENLFLPEAEKLSSQTPPYPSRALLHRSQ